MDDLRQEPPHAQDDAAYRKTFATGASLFAWFVAIQWVYLAYNFAVRIDSFKALFADFDMDLPIPTRFMLAFPSQAYAAILGAGAIFSVVKEPVIKSRALSLGISLSQCFVGFALLMFYFEAVLLPFVKIIPSVSK